MNGTKLRNVSPLYNNSRETVHKDHFQAAGGPCLEKGKPSSTEESTMWNKILKIPKNPILH